MRSPISPNRGLLFIRSSRLPAFIRLGR
jgi:hypothetical protein